MYLGYIKCSLQLRLWLVSTERYGSVQYGTVRFGMEHPNPACQQYPYLIGVVYAGK